MRTIHCTILVFLFAATAGLYSQNQRTINSMQNRAGSAGLYAQQETVDALQTQRIEEINADSERALAEIVFLRNELHSLRADMAQLKGIGVGVGVALTALQGLLVIVTYRKKEK